MRKKTSKAKAHKVTQTKAKKETQEGNESGNWKEITVLKQKAKPETKFQSSEINAQNAMELFAGNIQPECNKYCTDTANEKEQIYWKIF